ncbi:MAG: hypothetical protein KBG28_25425 [Kofleriaceae bacterium]|nr:hypothetical protein [Kofleriaceae bacterium]
MRSRRTGRWLAALMLTAVPALAGAGPAAAAPAADLDGDGQPDPIAAVDGAIQVTLSRTGRVLRWSVTLPGVPVWLRGARAGTASYVVAGLQGAEDRPGQPSTAVALALVGARLERLWHGPIGPVGADGEYAVAIEPTPRGLVRYQTRADVARCDGATPWLYPEGWDAGRARFAPIKGDPAVPAAAPTVVARVVPAPTAPGAWFRAGPASSQAGALDAGALVVPRELGDADTSTVWRPAGSGRGAFITFRAAGATARAVAVTLATGPGLARPRRLAVVGAGDAAWIELPATGASFVAELPRPIAGCVSVVVDGGVGPGPVALAELAVLTDADQAPGGPDAALVAAVAADGADAEASASVLRRRGPAATAAISAALATDALGGRARQRLLDLLVASRDPAAAPALAAALARPDVGAIAAEALARALAGLGAAGRPGLIAGAGPSASPAARRVVWEVLSADRGADASATLLASAGTAPRSLQRDLVRALASRGAVALVPLAAGEADPARAADLWRGLDLALRRADDAVRAQAMTAMRAAVPAATDYRVRYRLLSALASHGDDATVAEVARAATGVLRRAAAIGLRRNPAAAATRLLARWLGDPDPGLRLEALDALAERDDLGAGPMVSADAAAQRDGSDRAIAGVLTSDGWPDLRRRAAVALGQRCQRPGPAAALRAAVGADPHLQVRLDALGALVGCRAAGIGAELLTLAQDRAQPLPVRRHAVGLLVVLADRSLAAPLAKAFAGWRAAAYDDAAALALAASAGPVLGRLGGPAAGAALLDALGDEAFPELLVGAATGLRLLGPACPRGAAARLGELAGSDAAGVATAARAARAVCSR